MTADKFGDIISARQVRIHLTATVKLWIPDYLAEVAESNGRERSALEPFRSYVPMLNIRNFAEDQLPACVIVAPGTMANPRARARKQDARWAAGIGAVVSGRDSEETYELAELYAAAVRTLLLQHQSLGGFAEGIVYMSEAIQELDDNSSRTLMAGIVQIGVDVNGISDPSMGPSAPSQDVTVEPGDWPTVASVSNEIINEGVTT